ncbi:ABC transporter substrate-binding protein [Xylanibacillus composti]|uniref:Peptide ABC transporter substrate-binding protein n=1 Tax=Xylanibacillus composti TaxID=1572762 RepID=A0A8J4H1F4_9BACL|nr:ABC transporter substrate-binding protein [Xylanibacillus composti]MDT9723951.1 ABC transporter substrate-binding protein [Xylanibacillus composti]GIQ67831.1 peptide ABC transporter substrate-binding protein [Xylanibacillus composti]
MKTNWFLLVLSGLLLTAACSSPSDVPAAESGNKGEGQRQEQKHEQELIIADQQIATSLDPVESLTASYLVSVGAAETLFKVNAGGEVEPALAASAQELDPMRWEIRLREGPRFWSGKEIDADAVIASLERSREKDLQAQPFLDGLRFEKADTYTIHVHTERSYLPVPLNLSYYQTIIHNADAAHDAVETMDLSGMYKVVEFLPKQKMALEAHEGYWGTQPEIRRIVHEEIGDEQTRVLAVLSGRSHIAVKAPVTALPQFANNDAADIVASPAANTQTIYLNLARPQLADARVRQALSWALDREELVMLGAEGQSEPVTTWLGSNPAYAEAGNSVYTEFSPDKAAALLDEAGWVLEADGIRYRDGEPLTVRLMTWGGDKALGEALQSQWMRAGVKAEVQHGDYSLIQTARETGDWDASIEAWSTFGDEYTLLSGQFSPDGSANYGGFADPVTNEWLEALAAATDASERREWALKINERVAELAPIISLFPRPQLTAVSAKLEGFEEHFRQFENIVHANLKWAAE